MYSNAGFKYKIIESDLKVPEAQRVWEICKCDDVN